MGPDSSPNGMRAGSVPARHFHCPPSASCDSIAYFTEAPLIVPDDTIRAMLYEQGVGALSAAPNHAQIGGHPHETPPAFVLTGPPLDVRILRKPAFLAVGQASALPSDGTAQPRLDRAAVRAPDHIAQNVLVLAINISPYARIRYSRYIYSGRPMSDDLPRLDRHLARRLLEKSSVSIAIAHCHRIL
jgi:hypothetical protein